MRMDCKLKRYHLTLEFFFPSRKTYSGLSSLIPFHLLLSFLVAVSFLQVHASPPRHPIVFCDLPGCIFFPKWLAAHASVPTNTPPCYPCSQDRLHLQFTHIRNQPTKAVSGTVSRLHTKNNRNKHRLGNFYGNGKTFVCSSFPIQRSGVWKATSSRTEPQLFLILYLSACWAACLSHLWTQLTGKRLNQTFRARLPLNLAFLFLSLLLHWSTDPFSVFPAMLLLFSCHVLCKLTHHSSW